MVGKVILIVAAHPDDPEFGCGATVAKYIKLGATAYYLICTNGDRGSKQQTIDKKDLTELRQKEQKNAANIIGTKETFFLDHEDGNLIADINFKEEIVKIIRRLKPDIIFTHDPSWYYSFRENFASVNYNDHRKTGEATLDAIYPLARAGASFPDHAKEGLTPHTVKEIYLFNFSDPNYVEDVTDTMETKMKAIIEHKSQVNDLDQIRGWVEKVMSSLGKKNGYKYAEGFNRLILR